MTTKAFIALLVLIPLLIVAGNQQTLGQLERLGQGPANSIRAALDDRASGPPEVKKPVDWRKAERDALKADDWRSKIGSADPNTYRVDNGKISGSSGEVSLETVQILEGTEQDQSNTRLEGVTPAQDDEAGGNPAGRTERGAGRLPTERSTPGEVGGTGTGTSAEATADEATADEAATPASDAQG